MDGMKKMRLVLFNLYLFKKIMVLGIRKKYNKFWKNKSYDYNKS